MLAPPLDSTQPPKLWLTTTRPLNGRKRRWLRDKQMMTTSKTGKIMRTTAVTPTSKSLGNWFQQHLAPPRSNYILPALHPLLHKGQSPTTDRNQPRTRRRQGSVYSTDHRRRRKERGNKARAHQTHPAPQVLLLLPRSLRLLRPVRLVQRSWCLGSCRSHTHPQALNQLRRNPDGGKRRTKSKKSRSSASG